MRVIKLFLPIIDTFENEDLKMFAITCLNNTPDYFWSVPASSTGKYHPKYALGNGGLVRHSIAVCMFLNHFFEIDYYKNQYTSRERDLLRIAGMMHDTFKCGTEDDYSMSKYTKFEHPLVAAEELRKRLDGEIDASELEYIASAIETHMGQWNRNTKYKMELPVPTTKEQALVHLADYLASRKNIEINFEATTPIDNCTIDTYKLDFGKHKGKTLLEVKKEDPGWIIWAKQNLTREPVASLLSKMK